MTGDIVDRMCNGIDNTKLVLVFITERYALKVQEGYKIDEHIIYHYWLSLNAQIEA